MPIAASPAPRFDGCQRNQGLLVPGAAGLCTSGPIPGRVSWPWPRPAPLPRAMLSRGWASVACCCSFELGFLPQTSSRAPSKRRALGLPASWALVLFWGISRCFPVGAMWAGLRSRHHSCHPDAWRGAVRPVLLLAALQCLCLAGIIKLPHEGGEVVPGRPVPMFPAFLRALSQRRSTLSNQKAVQGL